MKEGHFERVRALLKRRNQLKGVARAIGQSAAPIEGQLTILVCLPDHLPCDVARERLKSFLQNEIDRIEDQLTHLGVELESRDEERKDTA